MIRNKQNGKGYVGATKWSFKDRYPQGKWWKWTHSPHLRRAYEKYGLEAFEVSTLESDIDNETTLYEREAHYIQKLNTFIPGGYNLTRGGGSTDPMFVREYDLIDFDGNMYHVVNLSLFCRRRKLNYSAMCSMVAGISRSSHGFALSTTPIEDIVIPNEEWAIENVETGEVAILRRGNVRRWAKEQGLNPKSIEQVVYGQTLMSQGWKLVSTVLPKGYRGIGPKIRCTLVSPEGERVVVDNVYAFAQKHNLARGQLYDLIRGRALEHKGWRCIEDEEQWKREKERRRGRNLDVISPSGETLTIKNVSAFCREHKLNTNSFFALVTGRSSCYRGWKLA